MAKEKKDPFEGKNISATKGGKIEVTSPSKPKVSKFNWGPNKPTKPMNFTEMPATCVCGKSLILSLQNPSYDKISWGCFCTTCRWRVTVSLTR